jgi:hypothetical protein
VHPGHKKKKKKKKKKEEEEEEEEEEKLWCYPGETKGRSSGWLACEAESYPQIMFCRLHQSPANQQKEERYIHVYT